MGQRTAGALLGVLITMGSTHAAEARMSRAEKAVVKRINGVRKSGGLRPLRRDRHLNRAADVHSRDMVRANFFAHASPDGTSHIDRIKRFERARDLGETLAYTPLAGPHGARAVVRMWVRSPAHFAVMRSAGLRRVGVAKRRGRLHGVRVLVWTADYAGS